MNKALAVIALIVILFGSKLYMENRYEKGLDQVIAQLQPYLAIDYRDLNIGLDGTLSLSRLELRSAEFTAPVTIAKISVSSSDRLFLFKSRNAYRRGETPDSFTVSIKDFEVDTRQIQLSDPKNECKYIEAGIDYSSFSGPSISGDVTLDLDLSNHSTGLLSLSSTNRFSTTESLISFNLEDLLLNNRRSSQEIPISTISVSDKLDRSHAQSLIDYCANKLGLTSEEFVNNVIGSPEFTQGVVGVDLGDSFRQALKNYYKGNGTLKIHSEPSREIKNIVRASLFKSKDIIRMLNLTAQLNGKIVPIEITEMAASEVAVLESEEVEEEIVSTPTSAEENLTQDPRIAERIRYEARKKKQKAGAYQSFELTQANKYINYSVRVKRRNKSAVVGKLKNYDRSQGKLIVEVSGYGGGAVFTIDRSDVVGIAAYR